MHEELLRPAQERARALVDRDPELTGRENALVRLVLERRYGERLKLFGVG